jgi:hypothetical protein
MALPSLLALAQLCVVDRVGGDALLLDEFLDLGEKRRELDLWARRLCRGGWHTRSKVFLALSETKGRAIGGIASEAGMAIEGDGRQKRLWGWMGNGCGHDESAEEEGIDER